ncbi:MAG: DUF1638 domain-containing protein [Negativicutes bacterium]|nr:DUF1638 domain-containing protein [Negativicutes bacterium]
MVRLKAIMCEVMQAEWQAVNPGIETVFLEQGLHRHPEELHKTLQNTINEIKDCDAILLGYGLCSNALLGIKADRQSLILPLVEDCIGLFLGSMAAYLRQFSCEPATYYFTKGWVDAKKDPYQEYLRSLAKWGEDDARWVAGEMMKNYRRAAYIDTGCYDTEEYYRYMCRFAEFFGLQPETLTGSMAYFRELAKGEWQRCLVVAPGEEITEESFRQACQAQT